MLDFLFLFMKSGGLFRGIAEKIFWKCRDLWGIKQERGSTSDGEFFVQELWDNANLHFEEVKQLGLVQFTILPARRQERIICIFRLESYR